MTIGQILDRILRLMKVHWRLLFGVAAVPAAINSLIFAAFLSFMIPRFIQMARVQNPGVGAPVFGGQIWFAVAILITYPILIATFSLYMAAASFTANQADTGVTVTVRQAYDVAWQRCGRYFWLMILYILLILVPFVLLIGGWALVHVLAIKGGTHSASVLTLALSMILLFVVMPVYAFIVLLRLAVAYPACVEEDISAWTALRRSFSLTRKAIGRTFVVMLVIYAIGYAVMLVVEGILIAVVAIGAAAGIGAHITLGSPAFIVLVGLGVLLFSILILVYTAIFHASMTTAIAVIYHDQRRRLDGFVPALRAV
jgi:hypothetical protein